MELNILCILTFLNIAMLLANIWMRFDSQKTLEEIKERSGSDEID